MGLLRFARNDGGFRNDGMTEFLKIRHCEALKKPKQSHLLSLKICHCEGAKRPKQSHLLNLIY